MIIIEKWRPNCLGYALCRLGVLKEDLFVHLEPLEKFPLEITEGQPEAIGVLWTKKSGEKVLVHLAVVDPTDANFVFHRRKPGKKPRRVRIEQAFERYSGQYLHQRGYPPCEIVNLRVKR